jgi:hypothetical protein
MRSQLASGLLAWLLTATADAGPSEVIYGVPEAADNVVGAWDENIMADDVHFKTAAIISRISMRLAIQGTQTCKLWIFDGLDKVPLFTVPFTNTPALYEYDTSTYDFEMQLMVPRDIYVGFSAQGDGWGGVTNIDYWSLGTGVPVGVTGTAGEYYYGTVTGGKLTAVFAPAANTYFGCLQIWSEPVRIDTVSVKTGHVHLAISSLPLQITSIVERCESAGGANWQEVAVLPLGSSNQTWSASNNAATATFYRVKSR